ncbi:hypothetical protein AAC387_Pa03g0902 [Persea americana]
MAKRFPVGHGILNGDSLCSFISHLGRPRPFAPTSRSLSSRKEGEFICPGRLGHSPSFSAPTSDSSSRATTSGNLHPRASTTCFGHSDSATHHKRCAETGALHLLLGCYALDTDPAPSGSVCSSLSTSCCVSTTPQSVVA